MGRVLTEGRTAAFPATMQPGDTGATMSLIDRFKGAFDGEAPKPSKKTAYPIRSAKVEKEISCICLSERPVGTWSHFLRGNSYPCTRNDCTCPFRHTTHPPRWKGYVAALELPGSTRCMLELTAGAVNSCPKLMDNSFDLRGSVIKLARQGENSNSPVWASVSELLAWQPMYRKELPAAWDIREMLLLDYWKDPMDVISFLPKNPKFINPEDDYTAGEQIPT